MSLQEIFCRSRNNWLIPVFACATSISPRPWAGFTERNPPPHDTVPDAAREAAQALNRRLHPMNDGIPDFLDWRKSAEPSYLDLVEGRQ